MSIKEEIEPYLEYIVAEISDMKMFEKERVKTLLLLWFADTVEGLYNERAEELAGQAVNNQRSIEFGGLPVKDKLFLQNQNTVIRERRSESRRMATVGKDIQEFEKLKEVLRNRLGPEVTIQYLNESRRLIEDSKVAKA